VSCFFTQQHNYLKHHKQHSNQTSSCLHPKETPLPARRTTSTRSIDSYSPIYTIVLTAKQGIDSLEKKQGQDPNKLRSVNEKVTDTARGMFEKATGTI
jgi:hypothetical protein